MANYMCRISFSNNIRCTLLNYGIPNNYNKLSMRLINNLNSRSINSSYLNNLKKTNVIQKYEIKNCYRSILKSYNRYTSGSIDIISKRLYSQKVQDSNEDTKKDITNDINSSEESKNDKKENKKKSTFAALFSNENAWKVGLVSIALMGSFIIGQLLVVWGSPQVDSEGNAIEDEYSVLPAWKAYPLRTFKEMNFFTKMIRDPSSNKLLPDPQKDPWYQPRYTLVLELTGVLVHPDWTLATGWRFKKRPAVDYFLKNIASPNFEVVIYTHEQGFTAFPIINDLDKSGSVAYRLFRDATKYVNGKHVKDLDCLNRDLSKVIVIDCDKESTQLHPRNSFVMPRWKGEDEDRSLVDLTAFLKLLLMSDVEDVRTVLDHYKGFDDPIVAFKENQRTLQEYQEKAAQADTKTLAQNYKKMGSGLFSKF